MSLLLDDKFLNDEITNASNYDNYIYMKKISIYISKYDTIVKITLPNFTFSDNNIIKTHDLFDIEYEVDDLIGNDVKTTYITYKKNINHIDMSLRLIQIKIDLLDILNQLNNNKIFTDKNFGILYTFDGNFSVYSADIDKIIDEFTN
jgi:hypothetical protein